MSEASIRAHAALSQFNEIEAAFDAVRHALLEEAAVTKLEDALRREKLILSVQVMDAVSKALLSVISSGEIERAADAIREQFPSA